MPFSQDVFKKLVRWLTAVRDAQIDSSPGTSCVATPFPNAHLSSVNVDGVEVCCHQGPQHEEEANEAGTEEEAEEVIRNRHRGTLKTVSQSSEPWQGAAPHLA